MRLGSMHRPSWPMLALAMVFLVGCEAQDESEEDATPRDGGASADAGEPSDAGPVSDGGSDAGPVSDGGGTAMLGFEIRVPERRMVPCSGMFCGGQTSVEAVDMDYLCTLVWGSWDHYFYLQSHPVEHLDFAGILYEVDGAWISDGLTATAVDATYDWGGNHHNDSMTVTLGADVVRYYHSSFGYGFRQCQPMDCLQIYDGSGNIVTDGCGRDRALPVVCVAVDDVGTVPPLVDTFARCPGDT